MWIAWPVCLPGHGVAKRLPQLVHVDDYGDVPTCCKPVSEPELMVVHVLSQRRVPRHDHWRVARGKCKGNGSGTTVCDDRPGSARHIRKHIEWLDPKGARQGRPLPIGGSCDDDLVGQLATRKDTVEGDDQPIHGLRVSSQRHEDHSNGPSTSAPR